MVESIEKLRELCQGTIPKKIDRQAMRKISIYFTWFLLHTQISANGVTCLFLIAGLSGSLLLAFGNKIVAIIGIFLLTVHVVLDFTDGEIARYRKTSSWFGDFLDRIFHDIVYVSMFLAIGWRAYHYNSTILVIFFAIFALVFTLLERHIKETKYYSYSMFAKTKNQDAKNVGFLSEITQNKFLETVNILLYNTTGLCYIMIPLSFAFQQLDILLYFYGITRPLRYFLKIFLLYRRVLIEN